MQTLSEMLLTLGEYAAAGLFLESSQHNPLYLRLLFHHLHIVPCSNVKVSFVYVSIYAPFLLLFHGDSSSG